jgi:hypothetical protein
MVAPGWSTRLLLARLNFRAAAASVALSCVYTYPPAISMHILCVAGGVSLAMQSIVYFVLVCIERSGAASDGAATRCDLKEIMPPHTAECHHDRPLCLCPLLLSTDSDSPSEFGEDDFETFDGFAEWQFEGGDEYGSGSGGAASSRGGRPAEHDTDELDGVHHPV